MQILVRIYLEDLKAGVGYNNVKAEVFKRRYVAAQLGDDAQHLVPVRKRALDLLLRVGMDGAWGYDVLLDDLGIMEKARFFIDIGENAAGADVVGKAGALCADAEVGVFDNGVKSAAVYDHDAHGACDLAVYPAQIAVHDDVFGDVIVIVERGEKAEHFTLAFRHSVYEVALSVKAELIKSDAVRADGRFHGKQLLFAQQMQNSVKAARQLLGAVGHFQHLHPSVARNDVVVILGKIFTVFIQTVAQRDLIPQKLAVFVVYGPEPLIVPVGEKRAVVFLRQAVLLYVIG